MLFKPFRRKCKVETKMCSLDKPFKSNRVRENNLKIVPDLGETMNNKGQILSITIIILLALMMLSTGLLDGEGTPFVWLTLLVLPFIWWLGKQYDSLSIRYHQLTNAKCQKYALDLDSFSGSIFVWDLVNEEMYFSKGMEQLLGFSEKYFNQTPFIWKNLIHKDDIYTLQKDKRRLLSGKSSQVEFRIHHPEHGEKWIMKTATPIKDENGQVCMINGQMFDITERKKLENKLKHMAYFDDLTDLPNRKLLDRHISKALAHCKRHHHTLSIMFIDLDDFKQVNDTLGHEAGDKLLKEVVARLNQCLREEDLIARIGGDEFIAVLEEASKQQMEHIAERIIQHVSQPYVISNQEVNISLSIGISMFPEDGEDKETLIEHADQAMYFAKRNGKNNYKMYSSDLHALC